MGKILQTAQLSAGVECATFEREVAQFVGGVAAVATGCGTSALALTLRGLEAAPGGVVIVPTYVCAAVAEAVHAAGLRLRLCDVGPLGVLTSATVAAVFGPDVVAVLAVEVFGVRCDRAALAGFGVPVVVDAAQRFPTEPEAWVPGEVARVYSFHATKCLTTGEGGMVTAPTAGAIERLRRLRSGPGLSDLQAALGRSQLAGYKAAVSRRGKIMERLCDALPHGYVAPPATQRGLFRLVIQAPDGFLAAERAFLRQGVTVRRGVDALLHWALKREGVFPESEARFISNVSIPCHPSLSEEEVARVVSAIERVWS